MKRDEFLEARVNWYAAYVAGDTLSMAKLEDPSFFVVSETGIQTRETQLEGIDAAVQTGRWFPVGSFSEDRRCDLQEVGENLMSVHGIGRIQTTRGSNPVVLFTELWQFTNQGWKVLHLHYHEAK